MGEAISNLVIVEGTEEELLRFRTDAFIDDNYLKDIHYFFPSPIEIIKKNMGAGSPNTY